VILFPVIDKRAIFAILSLKEHFSDQTIVDPPDQVPFRNGLR